MVLEFLFLSFIVFIQPLLPPILTPLSYSLVSVLLLQKANPRFITLVVVVIAVGSTTSIRKVNEQVMKKIKQHELKTKKTDIFSRIRRLIKSYFQKEEKAGNENFKKYYESPRGMVVTFLLTIVWFMPILPDIVVVRLLHGKIKFKPFVIALTIGKIITYVPFIFAGKGILKLIWLG